ncbi:MAG TPA: sulfatase-like hydrolase/transferase, partial [Solirubrobacteraceae bacterium]
MTEQDPHKPDTDPNQHQPPDDQQQGVAPRGGGRLIDRRTLLKSGLLAGGALAGGGVAFGDLLAKQIEVSGTTHAARRVLAPHHGAGEPPLGDMEVSRKRSVPAGRRAPNILMIMVDQLRTPQWFSAAATATAMMPNLARLRNEGVSFANHYTAANDCTPARAALLTGLYTHQTGCLITGGSTLDPGFPTWGTMLREQDYRTYWYGKWHLTHGDNLWNTDEDSGALEPYGFAGGTYPSPDGAPGQGWRVDPHIVTQFERWYADAGAGGTDKKPWCTTVSFVNPHDIAWWYRWSNRFAAEAQASSVVGELPPNFETPEEMIALGKPALQRSLQDTAQVSFGKVPYAGPELQQAWLPFMNLYLKLL